MIVYMKTEGVAHDIRRVQDDYELQTGEIILPGDVVPRPEELSDVIIEKPTKVDVYADIKKRLDAIEDALEKDGKLVPQKAP